MAVGHILTLGYGAGGTPSLVVTLGYAIGEAAAEIYPGDTSFDRQGLGSASFSRQGLGDTSFSRTGLGSISIGRKITGG